MNFSRAHEIAHRYDNCALQTGCFDNFLLCYSCLFLQQVVHVVGCLSFTDLNWQLSETSSSF
jgi:hypothetical protein